MTTPFMKKMESDPKCMVKSAQYAFTDASGVHTYLCSRAINFRLMGNCCYERGDFCMALKFYTMAIECKNENSRQQRITALANRAQVFLCLERPVQAIKDCRAVLRMDEDHVKARFRLGRALMMKEKYGEAIHEFICCLDDEPDNQECTNAMHQCINIALPINSSVPRISRMRRLTGLPEFGFQQLQMRPWCPTKPKHFSLTSLEGFVHEFATLDQLRVALSAGVPARPVAQIQLTDCELMSGLYNDFFYPLEVKLRDGGALKLNCVRGSEENFVQFLRLFQPISVHITSNENYIWDICSALKNMEAICRAKQLMLHPRYVQGQGGISSGKMICAKLTMESVLDWVHSAVPYSSPNPSPPIWAPPVPAGQARLVDVQLGSTTDQDLDPAVELANVWRSPVAKMLLFHAGALGGGGKCVERFIGECRKLFDRPTNQLNYSIKVMVQSGGGLKIKPRSLTNGMGEQLRVSMQKLTLDGYVETDYFPPHELVIIERFHTA